MKKSVYSLVLSDEVIAAVDAAAYASGMNRSAFVNSVLAQYVRYVTPEQRIASVLNSLESSLTQIGFRLMTPSTGRMINVGTALSYKYNPAVKYTVELYKNTSPLCGRLRVAMRTTNKVLCDAMETFFGLWASCENKLGVSTAYSVEQGRLTRELSFASVDGGEVSTAITAYINAFDKALKAYFNALGTAYAAQSVVDSCAEFYSKAKNII